MIQFFQTRSRTMVDSKDVISVKIEKINDTQIRCTLTSEDLADRQLKLSELAYGSEKAKDLFRDMMLQAQDQHKSRRPGRTGYPFFQVCCRYR